MGKIAIFLHHPKCSVQSSNGIINALSKEYTFKIFTKHEVEPGFLDDVDIVCFPGGIGDADSFDSLFKFNRDVILEFISRGGRYLGICMGAYWSGPDYFDIVGNTNIVQYIKQPNTCTRRPHAKQMSVLWKGEQKNMFFYDGCTFTGNNFETIATYPNGNPMAIMKNRIGLIGCHPEATKHWYDSYSWMQKRWEDTTNTELLLDFTNNLMKQ
jgi:hypothetical protein